MRLGLAAVITGLIASQASAQERFVERAPLPKHPPADAMARAGYPQTVARWAIPGVSRYEAGGYVGGGSLHGNRVLAKGPFAATGPRLDGTFGWDFAGFKVRPGRVFLAPSQDPGAGAVVARNYRTDGPHVPDVFSLRPVRKAVLEKREAAEERRGGH
ncbi:MAG: hypothetical protein K2X87_23765 [Gemmataceae bacterium]|nr:hypothetical protein [Gemmataceae bacterium]